MKNIDINALTKNVEVLSTNKTCSNCGGDIYIKTGICPYCGKKFINIEYASLQLQKYLPIIKTIKLELDDLSVALYSIKDYFSEVQEVITKNNIEDKIFRKLDEINRKLLSNDILSKDDDTFLRCSLSNDIRPTTELNYISVFRNILLNNDKKIVSYDTFVEIMKCYITDIMKTMNNGRIKRYNPLCAIYDFKKSNDEKKDGITYRNFIIRIDEQVIKNIYYQSHLSEFVTIFHELRHIEQTFMISNGEFNEYLLYMLKDQILEELCSKEGINYYRENYNNVISETDAEATGLYYTIMFLEKTVGIKLTSSCKSSIDEYLNEYMKKLSNLVRKINGKEETLNTLFDYYIRKHPELLNKYPYLNIEYILDSGIVRRKNTNELYNTLKEYEDNNQIKEFIQQTINKELNSENKKK